MVAGLCPDPLRDLKRSSDPLAVARDRDGNKRRKGKGRVRKEEMERRREEEAVQLLYTKLINNLLYCCRMVYVTQTNCCQFLSK